MCDTAVALGNTTRDGSVIFAKNSDRQPNEPLLLMYYPRKSYPPNSRLQCTYIEIDQVEETNAIYIHKPAWMWGCEMGTNEHGLTIGNEAVFTKEKVNKTGLLGMDLVRLALERCKTSEEAVECITSLLEKYGQGGNCGYEKHFTYHNSFLIADYDSAWVLETADKYWVAERVTSTRAISNRLSIGEKFDRHHPDVITHAIEKNWHKRTDPFHFASSYSDFLYTKFSGSKERSSCAHDMLQSNQGNISVQTMIDILQSHEVESDLPPINAFSVKSICMHAGFLYGDQTTGSYIISLKKDKPMVGWVTGMSAPCIAIYKPVQLFSEQHIETDENEALIYWLEREDLHRRLMNAPHDFLEKYMVDRNKLQQEIFTLYEKQNYSDAWQIEEKFVQSYRQQLLSSEQKLRGSLYFNYYWKKQNKRLYEKHESILTR